MVCVNLSQCDLDFNHSITSSWTHSSTDMYQKILDCLNLYFTPVIIVVGLVGNFLSFLVFTFTHVKRVSSSMYLSALALADILFLLALLVVWMERFHVPLFATNGWCEVVTYTTQACGFLAMWMVLSFTAERYIVTYHPLKKDKLCNRRKATIVVISLVLFSMVLYSHTFWTHEVIEIIPGIAKCVTAIQYSEIRTVMSSIDTILACIIPSCVIVILNIKIIIKIQKYQARRCQSLHNVANQKLTFTYVRNRSVIHASISTTGSLHVKFSPKSREAMELEDVTSFSKLTIHRVKCEQILRGSTQYKTARMLLVLSSVFVLLTIPNHIFKVQSFIESLTSVPTMKSLTKSRSLRKLTESFQLLYFLNFAINFFIYSVCGRQFRTGLRRLCKKWRHDFWKCNRIASKNRADQKPGYVN